MITWHCSVCNRLFEAPEDQELEGCPLCDSMYIHHSDGKQCPAIAEYGQPMAETVMAE